MRTGKEVMLWGACALLVLGGVARADGFAWDPGARAPRRIGARFFEEIEKRESEAAVFSNADPQLSQERVDSVEKIRLLHEIAQATSEAVTEDRIHVEQWSRARTGSSADESLEGDVVVVQGADSSRTFTVEGDRPASPSAKVWLQTNAAKRAKRDPGLDELDWPFILPHESVTEGGEWSLDPEALAREVLGRRARIDPARSHGKGKLVTVQLNGGVHMGHVEVDVALALETLGGTKVSWTSGGIMQLHYVLEISLEPARRDQVTGTISMTLSGEGALEQPGQDAIGFTLDQSSTVTLRKGSID